MEETDKQSIMPSVIIFIKDICTRTKGRNIEEEKRKDNFNNVDDVI
jgi:hypothetical protein